MRPNTAGCRTNARISQGLTSEALIGPQLFRPAGRGGIARVRGGVSPRRACHPHALVSEPVSNWAERREWLIPALEIEAA